MINPFTLKDIADTVMSLNQIHMRLSLRKPHSVLKGVWVSRVFRATKEPKPLSGPLSTRPLATRHQLHEHGLGNTTEMQTPPPLQRERNLMLLNSTSIKEAMMADSKSTFNSPRRGSS